jgi:hypothetical protein
LQLVISPDPADNVVLCAGHWVQAVEAAKLYKPIGQITGLMVFAGHAYPAGQSTALPSWQYFVAGHALHFQPPRGALASSTLYVPLLQVQLSAGRRAEFEGQLHCEADAAPGNEYKEFGQGSV